jgi:putative membrane protein
VSAIGAIALLRYWFFRFRLEEDRVLIHQGVLKRTALDLPFDRIQGINVERSLVDRILGLVTIRLDTAGTIVAEGRLPSVSSGMADWLRTRVDGSRRESAGEEDSGAAEIPVSDSPTAADVHRQRAMEHGQTTARDQLLLRLTPADMFRIGLADRTALVFAGALAILAEAAEPVQRLIGGAVASLWNAMASLGIPGQVFAAAAVVLAIVVVFLLGAVASAFLRHHDFTLWRRGTAYRTRGGLLTQKEVVVETAKIQQLTLSQNVVMRWFARYRFGALPAGALPMQGADTPSTLEVAQNLGIPLTKAPLAEQLHRELFGAEGNGLTLVPSNPGFMRVSPHYVRALMIRITVVPVAAGALAPLLWSGAAGAWLAPLAIWWTGWVVLSGLIALQCWRRRGYLHDEDGLASRRGLIGNRVDAFLFRKVQGVTLRRSPLQRRRGLATVEVHLASGVVTVPYIDHGTACRLRDYILYKVESSRRRWH